VTSYSYGEGQNLGYQNSETPKPTVKIFGIGDYVSDMISHAKIQSDCPWAITWRFCVILRLAILIQQYRLVTDRQTHRRQTHDNGYCPR